MSNITLFQSDHSCENIYKDQKTKKTIHSKLTRPFLWLRLNETLQWKKFLYFKHCYTSERMILFTQLKNDHTVKSSVLASDTWFLLKCGKAAASSTVCEILAFFPFPPQTTWPCYFPHIVFLLCLLTESVLCSHWSLRFLCQVWNCSVMHLLLQ